MDLSVFELAPEGAVLAIKHPITREPLEIDGVPVTVTMVGPDSAEWRAVQRSIVDRRLKDRKASVSAEEIEAEAIRALAACIKAWTGMRLNGVDLECNEANKTMVLVKLPHFRRQIDEFLAHSENFLKASAQS